MTTDKPESKRWIGILILGLVLAGAVKGLMSHPYFDLIVWTDEAISRHEESKNRELLLKALHSRILPHEVRVKALVALADIQERRDSTQYFSPEEIADLEKEFDELDASFFEYLCQPFLNGSMNRRLVETVLNPELGDARRFGAFLQFLEFQDQLVAEEGA